MSRHDVKFRDTMGRMVVDFADAYFQKHATKQQELQGLYTGALCTAQ